MSTLSIAIVCKNSMRTLPGVLEAVRPLQEAGAEIVVVDSGSTDGTIELLESRGARVLRSAWLGFVKTKQLALDASRGEWILSLDSDEAPDPTLVDSILRVVRSGDTAQGYSLNRKTLVAGRFLQHCWQPEWRLRLVRRGLAKWGGIDPHDQLELAPGAKEGKLEGTLRHDSFVSFADHIERQARYARLHAEGLFAAGRRSGFLEIAIQPSAAFIKQLVLKSGWRDGWRGVLAAASTAAGTLMKHIVLYEMTARQREG
ncbi:MAG: glycosyltransferase family 2 protein [Phycisphaerales bacterium]|nr:glycosyltransferase family 2 protein [Phycisphaerales bacterium]